MTNEELDEELKGVIELVVGPVAGCPDDISIIVREIRSRTIERCAKVAEAAIPGLLAARGIMSKDSAVRDEAAFRVRCIDTHRSQIVKDIRALASTPATGGAEAIAATTPLDKPVTYGAMIEVLRAASVLHNPISFRSGAEMLADALTRAAKGK